MTGRRVLIVTPFQLSAIGGVSTAVAALRDELIRAGLEVSIFVPSDSDRVRPVGMDGGARLFGSYLRSPLVAGSGAKAVAGFLAYLPLTLLSLRRFLRTQRFDVVAIQYPLPWMFYFGMLRRAGGWKLVVTYQGNDAHDLAGWPRIERIMVGQLLSAADAIVAVSRSLAAKVVAALPALAGREIRIIPNGATPCNVTGPDATHPADGLPADFIVTVGQLIHRKGIDVVIDALRIAAARGRSLPLVIVGDGPERGRLASRARDAGLAGTVHFAGSRPPAEARALLRRARLFVLASRAEGLPLVVVEAMACGLPVVASSVDGLPDVVEHGETGLLVPVDDADALAGALLELDSDDALRQRFGRAAQQRYQQAFTWRSIAHRYVELFEELLTA